MTSFTLNTVRNYNQNKINFHFNTFKDIGGIIPNSDTAENLLLGEPVDAGTPVLNTGAAEVMRQSFTDALDFVADFHSLMKIKVIFYHLKLFLKSVNVFF